MSAFRNRYATAIDSSDLSVDERTTYSDSDVIGAAGLASKIVGTRSDGTTFKRSPLAAAVLRLVAGDRSALPKVVTNLAAAVRGRAFYSARVELSVDTSMRLAQAVVGWYLGGVCNACHGRKFRLVTQENGGRGTLSDHACDVCLGTGRVAFDRHFSPEHLPFAQWAINEVERMSAVAEGAAAGALGR